MENEDNRFYVREIQTLELEIEYTKEFNLVKILIDNFKNVTIYMFGEFIIFKTRNGYFRLYENIIDTKKRYLKFIELRNAYAISNSTLIFANGEFKNNYTYKRKKSFWEWLWGNEYE